MGPASPGLLGGVIHRSGGLAPHPALGASSLWFVSLAQLLDSGPFRRADARAAGVGRRELERLEASGRVVRGCGGHLAMAEEDPAARAAAVGLVLPAGAAVCRETAAWLHGIDARAPGRHHSARPSRCSCPGGQNPVAAGRAGILQRAWSGRLVRRRRRARDDPGFARRSTCCAGRHPSLGWPPWTRWPTVAWSRSTRSSGGSRCSEVSGTSPRLDASQRCASRRPSRPASPGCDCVCWTPGCHGRSCRSRSSLAASRSTDSTVGIRSSGSASSTTVRSGMGRRLHRFAPTSCGARTCSVASAGPSSVPRVSTCSRATGRRTGGRGPDRMGPTTGTTELVSSPHPHRHPQLGAATVRRRAGIP